jgi:hypothetical protein
VTTRPEPGSAAAAGPLTEASRFGASRAGASDPGDDVRFAHLHLRLGMLSLALAELEDLERRGLLDGADRSMLAEARWRSGDAEGAAAAARVHLDGGGDDPVAICIAAEAAASDGRPGEARALMDRLGPPDAPTLDALFAGMPRRAFWPSGAGEAGEAGEAETLFGDLGRTREPVSGMPRAMPQPAGRAAAPGKGSSRPFAPGRSGSRESAVPGPRDVLEATSQGLWPDAAGARQSGEGTPPEPGTAPAAAAGGRRRHGPPTLEQDPVAEVNQARAEFATEPDRALLRLGLALRLDPTLAPTVLDIVAGRTEPAAALLRGDAQRLLGRHLEAEAAFASAAAGLDDAPKAR